ncbi:MAG: hypothetical protein JSU04_09825 [Bdellovibrionales bacterium]|nr:hypothetical protein [Bdellovibrionales bacterium]
MKRVVLFLAAWMISLGTMAVALAYTPDQYASQVLQKDLPRSLRWFGKITEAQQMSQAEVYNLYQSSLPETQVNKQLGISVKGSVERMVLLLDGARYFEQVQRAPLDYQNKKEIVMRVLQATKDEMDRFQYGEDPQVLLDEWKSLGVTDIAKFTADLVETFTETQKLLNSPVIAPVEQRVDAQQVLSGDESTSGVEMVTAEEEPAATTEAVVATPSPTPAPQVAVVATPVSAPAEVIAPTPTPIADSFENQRFSSYVQSAEVGKIAGECQNAILWKTDQAESCQSDDTLECDRSYARQCKKLQ